MAKDTSLPLRRAVMAHLKADAPLLALVPAARIYPPETPPLPAWPFVRHGAPVQLPFKPSGTDGSAITFDVQAFAKGPGEDAASMIGAAIAASLDGAVIDVTAEAGFPAKAYLSHGGTQTIQDAAEQGAWQSVVRIDAVVAS